MKTQAPIAAEAALPQVSQRFVKFFARYGGRYLRRRFHSIRILKSGLPPRDLARPLVIYLNHASWYDPLVCLELAREFFPTRTSFAPIDEASLQRYGFFKHLGFFGVEPHTARGAKTFLRTTRAILASPQNAVWLTPQGRFMDVRERPLRLERGLGALAAQVEDAVFLPLAIEYAFWTEPRPEILVSFGEPLARSTGILPVGPAGFQPAEHCGRSSHDWTNDLTAALESAQDELAARSCRRDPAEWQMLGRGASGISATYDAWRWLRARLSGRQFVSEHRAEDHR